MKRIAIFCDGTWNSPKQPDPTNVLRLHDYLAETDAVGHPQVAIYVAGVGAQPDRESWLTRLIDKLGGGAFGWGLTENLEEAYRGLIDCYEPGDQVYIFGFSRGAYTARSLGGLIRNCGIPDENTRGSIGEALRLYRERGDDSKPDEEKSLRFRADYSARIATSPTDKASRADPGQCQLYTTRYMGIWDTVGALGIPNHITRLAKYVNRKYAFHDTDLSSSVESARHAVAIDERRRTFPPTLWDNLDDLNKRSLTAPDQPPAYQQLWFPGVHGGVGGGGDIVGLSHAALYWIAKGAESAGLRFKPELEEVIAGIDPAVPANNKSNQTGLLWKLVALDARDRKQLRRIDEVSMLARRRYHLQRVQDAGLWRPGTLSPVATVLDAETPPESGALDR